MLALTLLQSAFAWNIQVVPGTDREVFWGSFPLAYTAVDDERLPDGADVAIAAAFETWSHIIGSQAYFDQKHSPNARPAAAYDEHHVIYVDHQWPYGDQALALAALWSDADSGELLHFDIRLNGDVPWSVDGDEHAYDLQSALTHEIGHVLGLDHSDLDEAAMWAALEGGGFKHDLHADDVEGILHLYGEPLTAGGIAGCSSSPAAVSGSWLLLLLAAIRRSR